VPLFWRIPSSVSAAFGLDTNFTKEHRIKSRSSVSIVANGSSNPIVPSSVRSSVNAGPTKTRASNAGHSSGDALLPAATYARQEFARFQLSIVYLRTLK
jgi:hypothetical protein